MESEVAVAYMAPATIAEAASLLAGGDDAKIVAGGQSLLVFLRQGLLQPRLLIGLKGIPELARIELLPDGGLIIGAMVTQHTIATSPVVRRHGQALAEAAAAVASPPIRRQGTIGGNLCHADPTADLPAALIALGAELEIISTSGSRRIAIEDFFVDYMETAARPDELLTTVILPEPAPGSGSAYVKHRVRGVDSALVGAAVALTLNAPGDAIVGARIGVAGAGPTPMRARAAEAALIGAPASSQTLATAAGIAAGECEPLTDSEGSEWYRREMVAVFVRRAAERALERAIGGTLHG